MYFKNKAGALVPYDVDNIPFLNIKDEVKVFVYSVGSIETNCSSIPVITIKDTKGPTLYRIPNDYEEWIRTCVGFAVMKLNPFPAEVVFSNKDGRYYADIL